MRKSILLSMFAALLLGLCSCSNDDEFAGDDKDFVANTTALCQTWQLIGYGSVEDFHMIDKEYRQNPYRFYLIFKDDGKYGGADAVNAIGGTYTCNGSVFKINEIVTTKIYDRSEESPAFLSHLHAAAKYGIKDGNKLRIYYSDNEFMYFKAIAEEQPSPITFGEEVGYVYYGKGSVHYNNVLRLWYIYTYVPGTIDSTISYYVPDLGKKYQVEDMIVTFSGTTYAMDKSLLAKIPYTGGSEYYIIGLTAISKSDAPLKIAIRDTEDGYAPMSVPISAETFFSYFSNGGWSQGSDCHVSKDGYISAPWLVVGGFGTILQHVSTTSLDVIWYGIGGGGEWITGKEKQICAYDERRNTLTYGSKRLTVLLINDKEMHCTMPLGSEDVELMSYPDVEPYVLKYYVFKHVSDEDIQQIISHLPEEE